MKITIIFILFFLISCSYPDIDSVPNFKEVKLTKEELFDLCQLPSADKSEIQSCAKDMQNKK